MKLEKAPKVICRSFNEDTVLLNPEDGFLHVLNPTGSDIWNLLDTCETLDDVIAKMWEMYNDDVELEELIKDIQEIIQDFIERKLIICDSEVS